MDEATRRKANEVFQSKLRSLDGRKSAKDEGNMPQSLAGFDIADGNICDIAGKVINSLQKIINTFSWLIPDKIENPALAFLAAAETVIMPAFCGSSTTEAKTETATAAKTNFGPKKS
jgi:hypothetical protein